MTQPNPSFQASKQRGNATIYVLLVVALFAALTFILSRQQDSSESSTLDATRAEIIANQVLAYPMQVKQAVDMMTITGVDASDLEFMLPGEAGFDPPSVSPMTLVFHPEGGGLIRATLPADAVNQTTADPEAGWYLGRIGNIEWTQTPMTDVVLVAWQIAKPLCEAINMKLTGSTAIPDIANTIPNVFIDESRHSGSNAPTFDASDCAACESMPALCVSDSGGTRFGYYSIIVNR